MGRGIHTLLLLVLAICFVMEASATSLDHIVGGSHGWDRPPNTTFFQEWASKRTFVVGDKLVFMYTPSLQNLLEVSKEDLEHCTQNKVINMYYKGATVLEIEKAGGHYYYSGVGTNCEAGQKLSINVSATPVPDPARDGIAPSTADHAPISDGAKSSANSIHCKVAVVGLVSSFLLSLIAM